MAPPALIRLHKKAQLAASDHRLTCSWLSRNVPEIVAGVVDVDPTVAGRNGLPFSVS